MRNLIVSSVFLIALSCLFHCQEASAQVGIITTVAGNGEFGFSGDGGLATEAAISPSDVFVDSAGNMFIADSGRIRKVDGATGIITTVAGIGLRGFSGRWQPCYGCSIFSSRTCVCG